MKHQAHHIYAGLKDKNLREVYLAMSLRTMALSLIMVFVPIYLYNLGYGLTGVLSYYLFVSIFYMLGDYATGKMVARFGPKSILAISFPLMIINFIFLLTLPAYHWPLYLLALSYTIPGNLFWIPYHNDFSKAKKSGNVGEEIGVMKILTTLLGALGPLIGGIIAGEFGIQYTIGLTIFVLVIGTFPILKTPKVVGRQRKFDMRTFSIKDNWQDIIAYGGYGLEEITSQAIWPLFIFLIVGTYREVGFITTLALVVAILVTVLTGKVTDKYEKRKVLRFGGIVNCSSGFAKAVVTGVAGAYLVSTFASVAQIFLQIPFLSEYYLHADREARTEYIVGMEAFTDLVRALGIVFLIVLAYIVNLKTVLVIGLLMGAFGSLLVTFISRNDRKEAGKIKVYRGIAKART